MLYEVFLIFLGMVITVIFQDYIADIWLKIKKAYRKIANKGKKVTLNFQEFFWGNRKTNIVVIDGDGYRAFSDRDIVVNIEENDSLSWPDDVTSIYNDTLARFKESEAAGESIPWNGETLSLYKYRVSRTANTESYAINLFLRKSEYYWTYSTIQNLATGNPSLKEKYIDSYVFENDSVYKLPNSVGLCLLVITRDNKAIYAKRSNTSGFRPCEFDVSVVEGINPELDVINRTMSFTSMAMRAVQEEIGDIDRDEMEIDILGVVFDKSYNQWNVIGCCNIGLKCDEIIKRRNSGTSGKWELTDLVFVTFTPKDVICYLSKNKVWDMGMVTTYFSLVRNGYSKKRINEWILRLF